MKKIFVILSLFAMTLSAMAQPAIDAEAKAILDRTSAKIKKSVGMKGAFDLVIEDAQSEKSQTLKGSFLLKGECFLLSLNKVETYFDGKTQWVYMVDSEEVTISEPTKEELAEINPMQLLSSYNKGYQIRKDDDRTYAGKVAYCVNLYPLQKDAQFFLITILVDKNTQLPLLMQTKTRSGVTTSVKITSLVDDASLAPTRFVFDPNKHKSVEIIDLR